MCNDNFKHNESTHTAATDCRKPYFKIIKKTALAILFGTFSVASAVTTAPYTVVLSGIDSPRGMDVDSKGNLYIASAGYGGSGAPFLLSRSSLFGPICQGNTGKILRLSTNGKVKTIVDNLPSHANCQDFNPGLEPSYKGTVAAGLGGLQVVESMGNTSLYISFGGSTEVTSDFCLPGGAFVGTNGDTVGCLPGFRPSNPWDLVGSQTQLWGSNVNIYNTVGIVNVNNYTGNGPSYKVLYNQMKTLEGQINYDGVNIAGQCQFPGVDLLTGQCLQTFVSNPPIVNGWTNLENDVTALVKVGNTIYAADAGANVIWALKNGTASVAVVVPNVGCSVSPCTSPLGTSSSGLPQSVPTSIAQNPVNGKIYVAELQGFNTGNFGPGTSRLFLFDPSTSPALTQVSLTGGDSPGGMLSATNNIAFDPKGNLYVVEYNNANFSFASLPLINHAGTLLQIKFSDPTHGTIQAIDDTIPGPTGVAIGNGKIYVGDNQDAGIHQAEIRAYNLP